MASSPSLSLTLSSKLLGLNLLAILGLDRQVTWPQVHSLPWPRPECYLASSPLLSLASSPELSLALTGDFLGLKPITVISLDQQFPPLQAHHSHLPQTAISLAYSPLLSLALTSNLPSLNLIAAISLARQLHWPPSHSIVNPIYCGFFADCCEAVATANASFLLAGAIT